jgi:hypothetical protein
LASKVDFPLPVGKPSRLWAHPERHPPEIYNRPMAIEFVAQRLQIGDVILTSLPDQEREVEATVVREIDRTETAVRATLRVKGREDFVKEWPVGEIVTVVRGP